MDRRVQEEASRWRARLAEDRSAETRAAFKRWRAADAKHAREYDQQDKLWRLTGGSTLAPGSAPARAPSRRWGPVAAAGVLGIVLVTLWPRGEDIAPRPLPTLARLQLLTRPQRLPDGSLVVLGPGARISPEQVGARRRVRLVGGPARFIVEPDPEPFVALAGSISVTAPGTVFDIDPTPGGVRVTLVDGVARVMIATDIAPVALAPGQTLDPGATVPRAASGEGRVGLLEVDGMAVADILAIAERSAGARVVLGDASIGRRRVTGRFDVGDPRSLARKLAAALQLEADERGTTPVLRLR